MHGLVLVAVKDLIVRNYSEEDWKKIVDVVKCPYSFVDTENYDEKIIHNIIATGSQIFSLDPLELLEVSGYWLIVFIKESPKHAEMLKGLGSKLPDVLNNMHILYSNPSQHSPELSGPAFRCSHVTYSSCQLHYTPEKKSRQGMAPFIVGSIKALGEVYLKLSSIDATKIVVSGSTLKKKQISFKVTWEYGNILSNSSESSFILDDLDNRLMLTAADKYTVTPEQFAHLFPFHCIFDKRMNILQTGASLLRLMPHLEYGDKFTEHFTILHPSDIQIQNDLYKQIYKLKEIQRFELICHCEDDSNEIILSGEMIYLRKNKVLAFVGSPIIDSFEVAKAYNLERSHFGYQHSIFWKSKLSPHSSFSSDPPCTTLANLTNSTLNTSATNLKMISGTSKENLLINNTKSEKNKKYLK
jgi:hypothetical protein